MPCAGAGRPVCAGKKGAAAPRASCGGPPPCRRRSLRLEHLFKGLARVEHAVLAGVPLDGCVLACRKAYRH